MSSSSIAPHTQRQKKETKNKTKRKISGPQNPQIKTQDKKLKKTKKSRRLSTKLHKTKNRKKH